MADILALRGVRKSHKHKKDKNQSTDHNDGESLRRACQMTIRSQYFRRLWRVHGARFEKPWRRVDNNSLSCGGSWR